LVGWSSGAGGGKSKAIKEIHGKANFTCIITKDIIYFA